MSDDEPTIFVLKGPFTERELKVVDELQAMLHLTSTLEVVRVALWWLATTCDANVAVDDFAVSKPRKKNA